MQIRFRLVMLAAVGGLAACAAFARLDPIDTFDGGPAEGGGGDGMTRSTTVDGTATFADAGAASSDTGAAPTDAGQDTGTVATFLCPTTDASVTDCSACASNPLACVLCGGSEPRMFCTKGRVCNESQIESYWCPCSGTNPAACPFERQTCYAGINGGICLTCGEQNATNGYTCNNGKTCTALNYACQ